MSLSEKQRQYWRRNLKLTAALLALWFVVSFVFAWFAVPLSSLVIPLLDFPAAYYIGAQGALIVYVLILFFYARRMRRYDREFDVDEGED